MEAQIKVIVEKHRDGYVAYPLGVKGVVVGQGDSYQAALGDRENVESRPFPRKLDFWAFCIVTALALRLEPRAGPPSRWGQNFIYTNSGIIDDDLASLLAIVAVAKIGLDDPEVTESRRIVELANRLAAAGCPEVLRKLQNSPLRTTPLDQVLEFARSLQEQVYDDS